MFELVCITKGKLPFLIPFFLWIPPPSDPPKVSILGRISFDEKEIKRIPYYTSENCLEDKQRSTYDVSGHIIHFNNISDNSITLPITSFMNELSSHVIFFNCRISRSFVFPTLIYHVSLPYQNIQWPLTMLTWIPRQRQSEVLSQLSHYL